MPPKMAKGGKGKKGKKKKEDAPPPPPETPPLQFSEEDAVEGELDLLNDINDEFFSTANKTIEKLVINNRMYEASKVKKYVDIIFNLHRKYADEVKETAVLRPKVVRADMKLGFALELTGTSQEVMEKIKDALGDAWKEADASQVREQDIQEKLQELIIKCESFENKQADTQDDSAEFGHLAKYKNMILRERDRINGEVVDLEKRLQMQRYYSESLEYINKSSDDVLAKLETKIKVIDMEKQTQSVKIRNLQSGLEDQKEQNGRTLIKLESCNRELYETNNKLLRKIADFDRQKLVIEKFRSENLVNNRQIVKNEEEMTEFRKTIKEHEDTIRALRLEDKVKGNTVNQLSKKYKKAVQDHSAISSKLYKINKVNMNLNEDIVRQKNQINALEKGLMTGVGKLDEMRRLKDNIQRERDALRSDIVKLNDTIAGLRHSSMLQANKTDSLRLDINKLNVKLDETKINTAKVEKERDEMAQEVETLHERIEYYQEQIQMKTEQVTDLTEKLTLKNHALINEKKQLEAVHSEKMMLQRSLETCTQERDDFRVLQMKTTHQIAQLSNEISVNHNKINSLNLRIERLHNEKNELQSELRNKEVMLSNVRKDLKEMKSKNENLMKTIADDELKFMKISTELDETRKEKNLIGLQMVRRNDEIILLKERVSIMQNALDQGTTQYNQRVEDIRLLKVEINNLQTERNCLSRAIKSTADMREEVIRLQRALNEERVRVRSLTEDSKTPTGVHRWRILKGEDPNKLQLLEKVQMLQRRNMKQEVAKTNLEHKLEEARKVAASLKKVVENLPTSDVKQRLVVTQRINRSQQKKLKALHAELAVDDIELKARECIIEEFKLMLTQNKQQICSDGRSVTSSDPVPTAEYTSNDNFMDCVFTSSIAPSQPSQLTQQSQDNISEDLKETEKGATKVIEDSKTL